MFYGGSPPTQRPLYLDEVGTRLVHTYQVFNAGPWRLSSLDISVDWPYQVAEEEGREGKPLLYLEDVPQVDGETIHCSSYDVTETSNFHTSDLVHNQSNASLAIHRANYV